MWMKLPSTTPRQPPVEEWIALTVAEVELGERIVHALILSHLAKALILVKRRLP